MLTQNNPQLFPSPVDKKTVATGKSTKYEDGWQVRGRYESGKQFRKIGFSTKKEANDWLHDLIRDEKAHEIVSPSALTTHGWLDSWLAANKIIWAPSTYDGYVETVRTRIKPHLPNVRLQELREEHVRALYLALVEKGHSTNTIKGAARRLNASLNQAVVEYKVPFNRAKSVPVPKGKPQKPTTTWSFEEIEKFNKAVVAQRDAVMWEFWITTGLRRGELCGLEWPKVDLDAGVALINWQRTLTPEGRIVEGPTKSDAGEREIPLDPGMVSALRGWRARQSEERLRAGTKWRGDDKVFTSVRHAPYSPRSFRYRLEHLCELAGVPRLTPHELRHTFGTRSVEDGMDIKVLSTILGHSKVELTYNLYVHPSAEQARAAVGSVAKRMRGLASS